MDKAFIESYYQTYNKESPEELITFYHDDVKLHSPQGTLEGAEAIISVYRGITQQFFDRMDPVEIEIVGDIATVVLVDKFTAKEDVDDFMGQTFSAGESLELRLRGTYRALKRQFIEITIEPLMS